MNIPEIDAKTIVAGFAGEGWFGAEFNLNIYRGCSHGCVYCDSRYDVYGIEDFDAVRVKRNALEIIERELRFKRKRGIIHTGSMSDPYNPAERELLVTRGMLHLADRYGFGIAVSTKSALVTRDIDVLKSIRRHSPAAVNVTITTADDALCRKLERNVAVTSDRLDALRKLADAGIPCGILFMPILPFINDTPENIASVVRLAREAGAKWAYVHSDFGVTLRHNQRLYFYDWLDTAFPGLRRRYELTYPGGERSCVSPRDGELWDVFTAECVRVGLANKMEDIKRIIRADFASEQLSLFGGDNFHTGD